MTNWVEWSIKKVYVNFTDGRYNDGWKFYGVSTDGIRTNFCDTYEEAEKEMLDLIKENSND